MREWRCLIVVGCMLAAGLCRAADLQVEAPAAKTAVTPSESGKVQVDAQRLAGTSSNKASAVEAWLRHMKERNPEEFERLAKLRAENPEAFQKVLKERLDRMRDSKKLEDLPHVKAFM